MSKDAKFKPVVEAEFAKVLLEKTGNLNKGVYEADAAKKQAESEAALKKAMESVKPEEIKGALKHADKATEEEKHAAEEKAVQAARDKAIENADLTPVHRFQEEVMNAAKPLFDKGAEGKAPTAEEVEAFKKAVGAAQQKADQAFNKMGTIPALERVKSILWNILGALLAVVASPVLIFSESKRESFKNTFFAGPNSTTRLEANKHAIKADDLVQEEKAAPAPTA